MGRPLAAREERTREGSARANGDSSKKPGSNPGSLEEKSMSPLQRRCLCSTAIPIALGFGFAAVPASGTGFTAVAHAQSANPRSPNPCAPCGAAPAGATGCGVPRLQQAQVNPCAAINPCAAAAKPRSEEHTSELQSLMRISYAVFCLKKKNSNCRNKLFNDIPTSTHSMTYNYYNIKLEKS